MKSCRATPIFSSLRKSTNLSPLWQKDRQQLIEWSDTESTRLTGRPRRVEKLPHPRILTIMIENNKGGLLKRKELRRISQDTEFAGRKTSFQARVEIGGTSVGQETGRKASRGTGAAVDDERRRSECSGLDYGLQDAAMRLGRLRSCCVLRC